MQCTGIQTYHIYKVIIIYKYNFPFGICRLINRPFWPAAKSYKWKRILYNNDIWNCRRCRCLLLPCTVNLAFSSAHLAGWLAVETYSLFVEYANIWCSLCVTLNWLLCNHRALRDVRCVNYGDMLFSPYATPVKAWIKYLYISYTFGLLKWYSRNAIVRMTENIGNRNRKQNRIWDCTEHSKKIDCEWERHWKMNVPQRVCLCCVVLRGMLCCCCVYRMSLAHFQALSFRLISGEKSTKLNLKMSNFTCCWLAVLSNRLLPSFDFSFIFDSIFSIHQVMSNSRFSDCVYVNVYVCVMCVWCKHGVLLLRVYEWQNMPEPSPTEHIPRNRMRNGRRVSEKKIYKRKIIVELLRKRTAQGSCHHDMPTGNGVRHCVRESLFEFIDAFM